MGPRQYFLYHTYLPFSFSFTSAMVHKYGLTYPHTLIFILQLATALLSSNKIISHPSRFAMLSKIIIMRPASRFYAIASVLAYFVLMAYFRHDLDITIDDQRRAKLQLQTIGSSYIKEKATAIDVTTNQNKAKVSYVTILGAKVTNTNIHPHRRENEAALLANIHNPHFDQVVVFLVDGERKAEACLYFHQEISKLYGEVFSMTAEEYNEILSVKLKCVDVHTGRPTYYQMFHNALSDVVSGDVVVLSNADMAFDDTISLARHLNPEVLVTLESRGFSDDTIIFPETKWIYERVVGKDLPRNLTIKKRIDA